MINTNNVKYCKLNSKLNIYGQNNVNVLPASGDTITTHIKFEFYYDLQKRRG